MYADNAVGMVNGHVVEDSQVQVVSVVAVAVLGRHAVNVAVSD